MHGQEPPPEIKELASKLLRGQITDPTKGATHFFSPISMPKEGESTKGFDIGGGLQEVPGITKRIYFPSWTRELVWVGDLARVRTKYFMFYRAETPSQRTTPMPKGGTGTSPNDPVPFGAPLEISVSWESANAKIVVLESKEVIDKYTRVRSVIVKASLGAVGKPGGIFPYYDHEFRVVGSKGKIYESQENFKIEILTGYSSLKELNFPHIDADDRISLLVFRLLPLSGPDINHFFALNIPQKLQVPDNPLGKTPDNPMPIGTPLALYLFDRGNQELTVLEGKLQDPESSSEDAKYGNKLLVIKIKIKALEDTKYSPVWDFQVGYLLDNKRLSSLTFSVGGVDRKEWKEIMAGNSIVDELQATVTSINLKYLGNPDFVFIWKPNPDETRYFALGKILTK